jgi:hypothetical protein
MVSKEEWIDLKPTISLRSGLTNYDVRYEAQAKGLYEMHVLLASAPIEGSPVIFDCVPSLPDVTRSYYTLPEDEKLYVGRAYAILLTAVDRCGNVLDHGGAAVTGRLQSANLPPQQEANLEVNDRNDGTYEIYVNLRAACELKVILSIDKELHARGGEFAPIPMAFVQVEGADGKSSRMKKAAEQVKAAAPAKAPAAARTAEELVDMAAEEFRERGMERASRRKAAAAGGGGAASSGGASCTAIEGAPKEGGGEGSGAAQPTGGGGDPAASAASSFGGASATSSIASTKQQPASGSATDSSHSTVPAKESPSFKKKAGGGAHPPNESEAAKKGVSFAGKPKI